VNSALAISNAVIKNLAFFVMIGSGHWNKKSAAALADLAVSCQPTHPT
jgi:hypothetical protein